MFRKITLLFATGLALAISGAPAIAQIADYKDADYLNAGSHHLGISTGVKLTVPFGTQPKKQNHQTRLGLVMSLDHQSRSRWSGVTTGRSADFLEIGLFEDLTPNLSLSGQNLLAGRFDTIYADDKSEDSNNEKSGNTGTILLIGGAVLIVGSVVIAQEAADDINDCFLNFTTDDPKCN